MLPLVFKTANAAGNTDYIDGLVPDIEQKENYANLGQLGTVTEPLLAETLNQIFPGLTPTVLFDGFTEIGDSNNNNILEGIMFIDK
jgi:hypothetical protein